MNWRAFLERILHPRGNRSLKARLKESEQRYQELVEQAQEGILVRGQTGEFLYVNPAFCDMLGYAREELMHMSIRDVVHPEDAETIEQIQKLQTGQGINLRKRMRRKDGRVLYVAVSARRLSDGKTQSTVYDLSKLLQAEHARRESENRFQVVVESAPNALLMVDSQGKITLVNRQAEKLFGYRREEMLGRLIDILVPPQVRPRHPELRQRFFSDPKPSFLGGDREIFGVCKDGTQVPVEISLNPIETPDGLFALVSLIDVTERKRAEQARRESDQRYVELVEQAADSIWLRAADGRMVFVNEATCRLLGYSREELLRSSSRDLIHPSNSDTAARIDALRPFETLRFERFMRHKDGRAIPVEASVRRLADGSVQVISHDITERKRIEEELRQMSQRLLEAQETERRAIARELHDEVGQALTATRINLGQLEKEVGDGAMAKRAGEAVAMVGHLLQQVRQLSLDLHPSVLDDLGLAAALRWVVRTRAGSDSLQVNMELADGLPRFTPVIEHTAFRVFQEALSNVLRHAEAHKVTVLLTREEDSLVLRIRDDGKGFEPEAARKHAVSGKSLGVLGMQERVRLAGGRIAIESGVGRGTGVQVWLPATERKP